MNCRSKGSLNPIYASTCGNKIKHDNFLSAMWHAEQLEKKDHRRYAIYFCQFCGFLHVGKVSSQIATEHWRESPVGYPTLDKPIPGAVARQGVMSPRWRNA